MAYNRGVSRRRARVARRRSTRLAAPVGSEEGSNIGMRLRDDVRMPLVKTRALAHNGIA
jgi:hypothetical protein